jgi:hypothetical protein
MKKTSKREYAHTNQQVTTHQHKRMVEKEGEKTK